MLGLASMTCVASAVVPASERSIGDHREDARLSRQQTPPTRCMAGSQRHAVRPESPTGDSLRLVGAVPFSAAHVVWEDDYSCKRA